MTLDERKKENILDKFNVIRYIDCGVGNVKEKICILC